MSSAVVSTSAALGRPFVFEDEADPEVGSLASASQATLDRTAEGGCPHTSLQESLIARVVQSTIKNQQSRIRPAPEMVSSGVPAIDALTGGLPRGCLTEICGPASSGRTTLLLAALAAATRRREFCVAVDASDALDPHSAVAAGVELEHLLWVRCGEDLPQKSRAKQKASQAAFEFGPTGSRQLESRLEQVLRATDLLLESGGFGLIVLDLGDLPPQAARRIPLTTWFRFRRAVEHTPTILLAIEQHPIAGSCSSLLLHLGRPIDLMRQAEGLAAERRKNAAHGPSAALRVNSSRGLAAGNERGLEGRKKICVGEQSTIDFQFASPTHAQLLTGLDINAELIRSRLERKPTRSSAAFASKTAWAG